MEGHASILVKRLGDLQPYAATAKLRFRSMVVKT